ncbi:MAG: bifunctional salicylyl-CoA 5-hydroxylase/oxidoreductase [Nannocystaceae bacterium]|nr:bifunctional salicylyl-CoA 5-hydroxylase/oxidoreductase [Nannocystaceae bacterium]
MGAGPAGLYFGLLLKKAAPHIDIRITERNRSDDTFGWGVVFSDETLDNFLSADGVTHDAIRESFVHWEAIDVHYRGEVVRSGGHGFSGVSRRKLLQILQARCAELGVEMCFETEFSSVVPFLGADLVVAADGVNSRVRTELAEHFKPTVVPGEAKFIWLGTHKVFDAFKFFHARNEHGFFTVHAYPFDATTSTFIVETDEASWRAAGLDTMSIESAVRYCESLFADHLDGNALMTNRSSWVNFQRVNNATWHHDNVVLIGDAAQTAHFSIGSGTKLAMEDAIALVDAVLEHERDIPAALAAYQESRWVDVAKLQKSALTSQRFFEHIKRYADDDLLTLSMNMMTRSKRVTHENLRLRDAQYIASIDRQFADNAGVASTDPPPPPMFTPLTLRGMTLDNRVVVSPMCMYSSDEGLPSDWHLVHLGSRAVGGAGLLIVEMTNVSADARITPGCTGIYDDAHTAAWRRITDFVHDHSRAKIALQLGHAGRKGATKLMWDGMDRPLPDTDAWPLLAASAVPYFPESQVPKAMDRADMDAVVADYVRAAQRADEAGFDMIEVHCAHGYLLASFISPLTNQRSDEYGGSIEDRMRFPLEVFDAVRAVWPPQRPISVRISATDWAPGGLTDDEGVAVAQMLAEHGCDLIDVSTGQTVSDAEPEFGRMYQTPFADRIKHEVGNSTGISTMAVGAILGWDHVNTILASGRADLCAMARPHLFDPYLTLHAAAEQAYWDVHWPKQYVPGAPVRPTKDALSDDPGR